MVVPRLPAVAASPERGARYLDLAWGLCRGPATVAAAFPGTTVTAVDGDAYTFEVAEREMKERGMGDRFRFVHSKLEDLDPRRRPRPGRVNISLHEARDIERAVARPMPPSIPADRSWCRSSPPQHEEDCRTVPAG